MLVTGDNYILSIAKQCNFQRSVLHPDIFTCTCDFFMGAFIASTRHIDKIHHFRILERGCGFVVCLFLEEGHGKHLVAFISYISCSSAPPPNHPPQMGYTCISRWGEIWLPCPIQSLASARRLKRGLIRTVVHRGTRRDHLDDKGCMRPGVEEKNPKYI